MNFFFKNYLLNIFCLSAGYRLTLYTSDISIQEESLFFFQFEKEKRKKESFLLVRFLHSENIKVTNTFKWLKGTGHLCT